MYSLLLQELQQQEAARHELPPTQRQAPRAAPRIPRQAGLPHLAEALLPARLEVAAVAEALRVDQWVAEEQAAAAADNKLKKRIN